VKLVDTSSWIHQMRPKGDPAVRARVEALLRAGEAAWCAMVRLEIWAGIGDARERRAWRAYESVIPDLPIDTGVWEAALDLAGRARRAGKTIPAADILICACAGRHDVTIEHADAHFDMLAAI
jgi:predicted nucleic acid-binding protein